MDHLNGSARQTNWMEKFSIFEALAISHIQRLTFQLVHCHSFQVQQRPCSFIFAKYTNFTTIKPKLQHLFETDQPSLFPDCSITLRLMVTIVQNISSILSWWEISETMKGMFQFMETKNGALNHSSKNYETYNRSVRVLLSNKHSWSFLGYLRFLF